MFRGSAGTLRPILLVDDEPLVLEGLRRMLRSQRQEWDRSFALGGEAARVMMEASPSDVLVSGMRMPGIDGAMLHDVG
jgi:DNA-binding NarL/FixJ family response regulator